VAGRRLQRQPGQGEMRGYRRRIGVFGLMARTIGGIWRAWSCNGIVGSRVDASRTGA